MNRQEEIAKIAHELFEKRGFIRGRELEDWLEAEQVVAAKYLTIEAVTICVTLPAETAAEPKAAKPENKPTEKTGRASTKAAAPGRRKT